MIKNCRDCRYFRTFWGTDTGPRGKCDKYGKAIMIRGKADKVKPPEWCEERKNDRTVTRKN